MNSSELRYTLEEGPLGPMHVFRLTGPWSETVLVDLESGVNRLVATGPRHIHLDLAPARAIPTDGYLRLASLASAVQSQGGRFGIRRSSFERLEVGNIFAVTKLLLHADLEDPSGDGGAPVASKLIPPPTRPPDARAEADPERTDD